MTMSIAVQDLEERQYCEMFQNHDAAFADLLDPDSAPTKALSNAVEASATRPAQSLLQPAVLEAIVSCHAAVYAQVGRWLPDMQGRGLPDMQGPHAPKLHTMSWLQMLWQLPGQLGYSKNGACRPCHSWL